MTNPEEIPLTPQERAVIEAAKAYDWTPSDTARLADLRAAVQALRRAQMQRNPQAGDKQAGRPEPGE